MARNHKKRTSAVLTQIDTTYIDDLAREMQKAGIDTSLGRTEIVIEDGFATTIYHTVNASMTVYRESPECRNSETSKDCDPFREVARFSI